MLLGSLAMLTLSIGGCGPKIPDAKPICQHLKSLSASAKEEWEDWSDETTSKCVKALSLVPKKGVESWSKELECMRDAKDLPSAKACADWTFFWPMPKQGS